MYQKCLARKFKLATMQKNDRCFYSIIQPRHLQYVPENWNAHKGKSKDAQLHREEEEAAENLIKQSSNIKG